MILTLCNHYVMNFHSYKHVVIPILLILMYDTSRAELRTILVLGVYLTVDRLCVSVRDIRINILLLLLLCSR